MGAGLLPHNGADGAVASASLTACLAAYVREGWDESRRDTRKRSMELQRREQVVFDRDLVTCDSARPARFFSEFLPRFDGKWWAGVGFQSGSDFWCLALHRTAREGQFDETDKVILQQFSARLSEIGNLSCVTGHASLSAVASSFDHIHQAVVAIDKTGRVIRANFAAEDMFGATVSITGGRLRLGDRQAAAEYRQFLQGLDCVPEGKALRVAPIVVRRDGGASLLIEALPIDGAARSPFLHARALLLLKEIGRPAKSDWEVLNRAFGLTRAEVRLTARLANGELLSDIAEALEITKETARSRLKSVFRKTDVHRQGELVALLASLLGSA